MSSQHLVLSVSWILAFLLDSYGGGWFSHLSRVRPLWPEARILEWVAISFSRVSSWPRNRTLVSCIAGKFSSNWATREDRFIVVSYYFNLHFLGDMRSIFLYTYLPLYIFLMKCLLRSLAYFLIGCFLIVELRVLCIFWIISFIRCIFCKYFLLDQGLSSHVLNVSFTECKF